MIPWHLRDSHDGIVMSGRRPLIKGYFAALRLIVGAVMSLPDTGNVQGTTAYVDRH
jgi:hypothetical protein